MLRNSLFARIVACAAGVAMTISAVPVNAAPQAAQEVRQGTDVVLVNGELNGKLLNANGKPVEGAAVSVSKNGKVVAKTVTKTDGSYTVAGLSNGTHTVSLADGKFPVRLWSKDTAPASSVTRLVVSQSAVRGQGGWVFQNGQWVWVAAGLAAIAGTILIVEEHHEQEHKSP